MLAHEWIRSALGLPADAPYRFDYYAEQIEKLKMSCHPGVTHCDNCGLSWVDDGLNPVGCPYCKEK